MDETIALRPLTVQDARVMATVLADPGLYEFTGGEPPTEDELTRRYQVQTRGVSADGSERWLNLLVLLGATQQPIGYLQATTPVDGAPTEIAWVIGRPWQGHGYAARAGLLLLDRLAEQGVGSVVAHVHPAHAASQRVAARLGLTPTSTVVDGEIRWSGAVPRIRAMDTGRIRHTVAFTLRHEVGSPEAEQFLADGTRILSAIPTVQRFECLRQVSPKNPHHYAFSMEFDDQAAYDAYDQHPDHQGFVQGRWVPEVTDFLEADLTALG